MQPKNRYKPLIASATFVTATALCLEAFAACHVKGCPPYGTMNVALAPNQGVALVTANTVPSGAVSPLASAITTINGESVPTQNGTGDTFTQYASYEAASAANPNAPVVAITFDTTSTTPPPCDGNSNVVACASYSPQSAGSTTADMGTITVYLNSQTCGGPCFNSAQSGYTQAIQGVIEHEIYHGLGIGNTSSSGSLMSAFTNINSQGISGNTYLSNNAGGTTSPTNCDMKETQRAAKQRSTGAPCPS